MIVNHPRLLPLLILILLGLVLIPNRIAHANGLVFGRLIPTLVVAQLLRPGELESRLILASCRNMNCKGLKE